MKYEWRKEEKENYGAREKPIILTIPKQNYITIQGQGDPNKEDFAERVGVLYTLSYQVKMRYKALCAGNPGQYDLSGYQDYTVFPLEGIWTSSSRNPLEKDCFIYTLMIRQPDFITKEIYEGAFENAKLKKPHPLLSEAVFTTLEDGLCVQKLHKGSYDEEPASFAEMDQMIRKEGYVRLNEQHREIYLTDARKTAPEKRKTILRYQISGRDE